METNLILTAKQWQLSPQIQRTKLMGGVQILKNIPARTYLAVTPAQAVILNCFRETRTVPQVLESAIEERICPALGEFYELILKAVRAEILIEPGQVAVPVKAINWPVAFKPSRWRYPLWVLFLGGVVATIVFQPDLPLNWIDIASGLGLLVLAALLGRALAASLLRGADAELYVRGRNICLNDVCMLASSEQRSVLVASLAVMSATTGFLAWWRPQWSFLPLLGLLFQLRPIFGGAINAMIRAGASTRASDAEHHYIFPGNRTVDKRRKLLAQSLKSPETWMEIIYGMVWTLMLAYCLGAVADVPPWKIAFWKTQGLRLGIAAGGSLLLLGLVYTGLEIYVFVRERARARHETFRQWRRRWFGRNRLATDEPARMRAVLQAAPFRLLPPQVQQSFAKSLQPFKAGPWQDLHPLGASVSHVSLILSGQVGVYRQGSAGRRVLVQVLAENDLVGLHAIADPQRPEYLYRTLTPVLLLRIDWAEAENHILPRLEPAVLSSQVQKIPFLSRISLCQNWHRQAVQRFAELSHIRDYRENEVILERNFFSENFFIVFEGEADVVVGGRRVATVGGSSFFGEIGLLQNSNATARVQARAGNRCLCIPRKEFLRFVAHNHTVALELEHVSSQRLGHPIFPLSKGNFKQL